MHWLVIFLLWIPGIAVAQGSESDLVLTYHVAPGATLSEVATRFGVRGGAAHLAVINGLSNPDVLRAGFALDVPVNAPLTDDLRPVPEIGLVEVERRLCGAVAGHLTVHYDDMDLGHPLCLQLNPSSQVCQRTAGEGYLMVYRRGQRETELWRGRTSWPWYARFHVLFGDLDGDRRPEIVVARLEAVSNGLGYRSFDVGVFDPRTPDTGVARFTAVDVDDEEPAVRLVRAGHHCAIQVQAAEEQGARRQMRGLYWVRRLYGFQRGNLVPRSAPIHRALIWANAAPETMDAEWGMSFPARGTSEITSVRTTDSEVELVAADGFRVSQTSDDRWNVRLVHQLTARRFPRDYRPGNPSASFAGPAHIVYGRPGGPTLWF